MVLGLTPEVGAIVISSSSEESSSKVLLESLDRATSPSPEIRSSEDTDDARSTEDRGDGCARLGHFLRAKALSRFDSRTGRKETARQPLGGLTS